MDCIRSWIAPSPPEATYEPMREDEEPDEVESRTLLSKTPPFSRFEYAVFVVMGVAMLWAWYVSVLVSRCVKSALKQVTDKRASLQEHVPCRSTVLPLSFAIK